MSYTTISLLCAAFFCIAVLYATVGHAGASGYLAVMVLLSVPPSVMRPTALLLNVAVSLMMTLHLFRHKRLDWRMLLPLLCGSIPAAFFGAQFKLSDAVYFQLLAVVMMVSAGLLFHKTLQNQTVFVQAPRKINWFAAVLIGAGIGVLSGMTGTGGGIFLSPLLVLLCAYGMRETAALSAPFILFNSLSGLGGISTAMGSLPEHLGWFVVAVMLGGALGARLSSDVLSAKVLLRILSAVMLISASKLVLIA
jgi:uncharacterized membrane protein YfcA